MLSVRIISGITGFFDAFSRNKFIGDYECNSCFGGLFPVNCVISSEGIPIGLYDLRCLIHYFIQIITFRSNSSSRCADAFTLNGFLPALLLLVEVDEVTGLRVNLSNCSARAVLFPAW